MINHKTDTAGTDEQTINHVRNTFRGDLIDWFNKLNALGINTAVWDNVKTAFKTDFRVAPSFSSVVHKIPDIKQLENETVIQYFSKALKTMEEFKAKIRLMTSRHLIASRPNQRISSIIATNKRHSEYPLENSCGSTNTESSIYPTHHSRTQTKSKTGNP